MMLHVPGDFNIDSIMRLNQVADTNFQIAGTWGDKKIPWKIWLHEPDDTLKPTIWLLSMDSARYLLQQSSTWEQSDGGEFGRAWSQNKSSWRIRTADGRWVPSLQDLGADLTID
jgi:hypothetical protein